MRYSPYPAYKPSRLPWLAEIPNEWGIHRLKWSVTGCDNGVWGEEPDGGDDDIVCLRVADFDRNSLRVSTVTLTVRSVDARLRSSRKLNKHDLLLEKSGGGEKQLVGCVVHFDHDFDAVCSNFVARMALATGHSPRFWAYAHAALYAGKLNYLAIKQTTGIQNLDSAEYLNTRVAYPPAAEQEKIAAFLDWKTGQIDALIAKKQALIEKLKEKRLAVITQAVTKGLDPSVPMKDSNWSFFGQIPTHWTIGKLARRVEQIEQGWSPACEDRQATEEEWGVLKSGCVNDGNFRQDDNKTLPADLSPIASLEVKQGDVLMCRASGSRHLIGSVAFVDECRQRLMFSDKTYRIRAERGFLDEKYFVLAMRSKAMRDQIELSISGAEGLANNIPQSAVKSYVFAYPPLREQIAIVSYLNAKLAKISAIENTTSSVLAKLTEYRSALITAATTGQIDVRNVAIPAQA